MISPLECNWYMELLLGMLGIAILIFFLNLFFVFAKKQEAAFYKSFDNITDLYIKCFSMVLLFTIIWIIVAALSKIVKF